MKKNKIVAINIVMGILLSQQAWGGIDSSPVKYTNKSSASKSTTNVSVSNIKDQAQISSLASDISASKKCSADKDVSPYFPLDFFRKISRDGSSLIFEMKPGNRITVKVPATIKRCGTFKPEVHHDGTTKNLTIMMKHESGKTYGQYLDCLRKKTEKINGKEVNVTQILTKVLLDKDGKDILDENNNSVTELTAKGETIEHGKISEKEYESYNYDIDYKFDKKTDYAKTMKISFGYPKSFEGVDGYPPAYGLDETVEVPGCIVGEKIQPETSDHNGITYINEGRDIAIQKLNEICKTGNAQEIASARKSLSKFSELQDDYKKIAEELDRKYLLEVMRKDGDVARIIASMSKLEDRLTKEKDTITKVKAKKLIKEFADLAEELDNVYFTPAIYRLDTLMKQLENMDPEDPKRKAIDKEIKILNENIGAFSKQELRSVYEVAEKHAINAPARIIEDIRLKSQFYAQVFDGESEDRTGKPITFEEAKDNQYSELKKFDKVLANWAEADAVRGGSDAPINKALSERRMANTVAAQTYANSWNKEIADREKYCGIGILGVKNPVQCKNFQAGATARVNAIEKRYRTNLQKVRSYDEKISRMGSIKASAQKRQVANDTRIENSSPYNNPFPDTDLASESFSELFPASYGAPSYDSAYDMGGQAATANLRNGYSNYPNAQTPVMPGQYQMQQQPWQQPLPNLNGRY